MRTNDLFWPRPGPIIPASQDLRLLSTAGVLKAWWRTENNIVLNPNLVASGTSPPAGTIAGNLAQPLGLSVRVEPADNTKFRWSIRNGWDHWAGGQNIPVASAFGGYALGSTQLTLTLANAAFNVNNRWDVCAASWDSIVNTGMKLDNSTVAATNGPYVLARPIISADGTQYRPAINYIPNISTGYLGNQGSIPAIFSGTSKAWHTFELMRLTSDNISTLAVAVWSCSDTVSTTQKYLMSLLYSSLAVGGNRYELRKRVDAGGTVLATTFPVSLDFSWFILEQSCDGTSTSAALTHLASGMTVAQGTSTWSNAAITHTRYLDGAVKLGTSAASNQPFCQKVEKAIYDRNLTSAEADAVRTAMAWAA